MAERRAGAPAATGNAAPTPGSPASFARPRDAAVAHHWLTLVVARPGPVDPVPAKDARVLVRPFPRGAATPGDILARGTTAADGSVSLLLPGGRYAVTAAHEGEGRAVTITLEHAGRAVLVLESLGRRVTLTVEASRPDGGALADAPVEARTLPGRLVAARGVTDERGVVVLGVPPGAFEVVVGQTTTRTYLEADTSLRVTAVPGANPHEHAPLTGYARRVRVAAAYVAPYDVDHVREDVWN